MVLLGDGGHESHLKLFGYAVNPLSKSTFYFSIAVLVVVDVIQSGFQKKLEAERQREEAERQRERCRKQSAHGGAA